ncbi:MAG: exodeoxyribonuclease VII large subunit [Gammaproteobacteria bacterium]|nr:MAG: exodeoxyribonuclease VII large subunit [Gammaproteobacteria bacterium]
MAERDIYSVSRLNREARALLEGGLPSVWIEGELSNFSRPASGHWYFTLKDEAAQVRCAMFRQRNLLVRTTPRDGMQVLLRARVGLYEQRGDFQLIADHLEEAGEGELRRRFELLKQRLAAEGLFDAARKRPLPRLPRRIGVVTSPHGAALHDVLQVLRRRFPAVPVLIYPVPVQGAGAGAQIAAMLGLASRRAEVDVLLLVRGGGSLEDLWSFNEEAVARAIVASPVPVVVGVGHEVDFTIADFAADVRAPTPSAAAELVVPEAAAWSRELGVTLRRLGLALSRSLASRRDALQRADRQLARLHPAALIAQRIQRLDELHGRLGVALRTGLTARGQKLIALRAGLGGLTPATRIASLGQRMLHARARLDSAQRHGLAERRGRLQASMAALQAVSPLATLERGYAIVTLAADGTVLRDVTRAPAGSQIDAQLAHGRLRARVE